MKTNKKLYESIMHDVAKVVKKNITEAIDLDIIKNNINKDGELAYLLNYPGEADLSLIEKVWNIITPENYLKIVKDKKIHPICEYENHPVYDLNEINKVINVTIMPGFIDTFINPENIDITYALISEHFGKYREWFMYPEVMVDVWDLDKITFYGHFFKRCNNVLNLYEWKFKLID